jgi:hypothetical protein
MTNGNGQGEPKGKEPVDWVKDLFVHTPIGLAVMAWKRVPEFVSAVPDLVGQAMAKGCAQIAGAEERISEEVRKARMIGEVAMTFGGRQLRREVDARLRDAKQAAEGLASFLPNMAGDGSNGAGAGDTTDVSAHSTPTAPASAPVTGAAKPAAKPTATEKAATKATGARKTTKSTATKAGGATKRARRPAAAASAADLPIQEYDGLSASQVVSRLSGLTPEELRAVRSYEKGGRGRRTVLVAIDRLL